MTAKHSVYIWWSSTKNCSDINAFWSFFLSVLIFKNMLMCEPKISNIFTGSDQHIVTVNKLVLKNFIQTIFKILQAKCIHVLLYTVNEKKRHFYWCKDSYHYQWLTKHSYQLSKFFLSFFFPTMTALTWLILCTISPLTSHLSYHLSPLTWLALIVCHCMISPLTSYLSYHLSPLTWLTLCASVWGPPTVTHVPVPALGTGPSI